MTSGAELATMACAAVAAGTLNALAGGGTLITFPALTAIGLPAVVANVTNTVALCPGYLGATVAQARDLRGQGRRLALLVPAGIVGGVAGALLLLRSEERLFRALVPWLILLATALLAFQEPLRRALARRNGGDAGSAGAAAPAVALAAVYGGYFGAGLSVIVLAALALLLDDTLTRLNALKQAVALGVNVAAAVVFVASGPVDLTLAVVMAAGALIGGALGGRIARRVSAGVLRWSVVGIGLVVSAAYFAS